jgi:DNA-binding MarR family transcriptional regulator
MSSSSFDSVVTSPGRLRILAALASGEERQPFVELRRRTGLTDGNLATHARRLQSAGFIAVEKSIHSGKPLTTLQLTRQGREALLDHARRLQDALSAPRDAEVPDPGGITPSKQFPSAPENDPADDDWVD